VFRTLFRVPTDDPMAALVRAATCFDEGGDDDEFVLPEDLAALTDEQLEALAAQAQDYFAELYDPEVAPSPEEAATLEALAVASDALREESNRREADRTQRAQEAAELAARVLGEEEEVDPVVEETAEATEEVVEEPELEPVAAASRPIPVPAVRRRQPGSRRRAPEPDGPTITASADLQASGLQLGDEVTVDRIAEALVKKVQHIQPNHYENAYRNSRRSANTLGLLTVKKNFPAELTADVELANDVMTAAVDQTRLPGGSLLASGGWCAPSETVYDLFDISGADGLISVPEFQVNRGGIKWTPGPNFASVYASTGFTFTELQDIDGEYEPNPPGPNVEGPKPCFKVECPDFDEERLAATGLCITAGILQNRAYPEVVADTIRKALKGHQHRLAGQTAAAIQAGSDAVALPANQVGALAPILTAIELQATHYRYVHRMVDSAVLEAKFPRWVRGAVRSDLSRRLGIDLLSVTDARIAGWFRERGINPQFIYNYPGQDLVGDADAFVEWPDEVEFLLYAAGTWTRGSSDIISLDAIFDSALLVHNDFTALFSEEGWLVAKRGHDSRRVTVPICADGATHGGVDIDCDGSEVVAPL
jgi:hypothetical protein